MPIAYPYKFSDWYGYDKDCATLTSFSSGSGQSDVKFVCTQSVNTTKYHDGSGFNPQVNDNVYDNATGTTATSNGFYTTGSGSNILGYYRVVSGVCTSVSICSP
jgi:hypothetical protein